MIQKFRWRFILISIISLFIVLFVTIGSLIGINFYHDSQESQKVMTALVRNSGNLSPHSSPLIDGPAKNSPLTGRRNPESVFQYRYFSVVENPQGHLAVADRPKQFNIPQEQINAKSSQILGKNRKQGITTFRANRYLYQKTTDPSGHRQIIFLNISLIYQHSWILLRLSIWLGLIALIIFALVLILLSGKAIQPIILAYHKQQQFITNAGHELKTPLAIISANTEMQEMIGQEDEWTKSTKEQTERLTNLINRLISLARMSETSNLTLSQVNFSDLVEKVSRSFSSVMVKNKLNFKTKIAKDVFVSAEEKSLRELINIFLDNAQKYCDPNGTVNVNLHKNKIKTHGVLVISNTYKAGKNIDYRELFDRFYREDQSHNSKKAGFGIGLSMAQDLVKAFKGKIRVHYAGDTISFIIALRLVK